MYGVSSVCQIVLSIRYKATKSINLVFFSIVSPFSYSRAMQNRRGKLGGKNDGAEMNWREETQYGKARTTTKKAIDKWGEGGRSQPEYADLLILNLWPTDGHSILRRSCHTFQFIYLATAFFERCEGHRSNSLCVSDTGWHLPHQRRFFSRPITPPNKTLGFFVCGWHAFSINF